MIATLPLAQLFFFHVLLAKKGISTYDYIVALREQELQVGGGQQSPQMSPASSLTGLSSASSFNTFHRGAWCTPPRLFLEDQFDVVPPDTGSVSSLGKKMAVESFKKKNSGAVKISPWTLARLNAEEVSKVAAEAKKKSKILQPVVRREDNFELEKRDSVGSSSHRLGPRPEGNKRRPSRRFRLPVDLSVEPLKQSYGKPSADSTETSTSLAPLQLEARSAFRTSLAMSSSASGVYSSPESSLDSPNRHPFRANSLGAGEVRRPTGTLAVGATPVPGFPLSRSTSDGYEPSGGEDSDRIPPRAVQRSRKWSNLLFGSDQNVVPVPTKVKASTSRSQTDDRGL